MKSFAVVDRLARSALALVMGAVSGGLVLAGSAKAASDGAFKTVSGNIVCDIGDTDVECVIKSGLQPAPPRANCNGAGDPVFNRVDLSGAGTAAPVPCAGDPGPLVGEADAKVLAYGSTMIKGQIGCSAFEFGLVCVNSKGRGFFLSRASARYF